MWLIGPKREEVSVEITLCALPKGAWGEEDKRDKSAQQHQQAEWDEKEEIHIGNSKRLVCCEIQLRFLHSTRY